MELAMEDAQNSAPEMAAEREASKLASPPRRNDAQSVTKR